MSALQMARTPSTSWPLRARAELERRKRGRTDVWPAEYVNSETGKVYRPHNDDERVFVYDDVPRRMLLKGGEGSGKTCAGTTKTLGRLRRGMDGIMVSSDLEHFKKSVWPEFVKWCPWQCVIERHRYRAQPGWEPTRPFTLTFKAESGDYATLMCGGCKEDEIMSWEGPNVNFVYFDEPRRHKTPVALKTFDGRARLEGPNGEPPQVFLTSTPRKHWMHDYFGPPGENDPLAAFKAEAFVGTVSVKLNRENLAPGWIEQRRQSLTEAEARVLMDAEWEDLADAQKFLASMVWWDACREELPTLTRSEPMVLALDAAKGGSTALPDCFAVVGVTRHPARRADVAVRYCGVWTPPAGGLLDYLPVEQEIRRLCAAFSVVEVAYDPYQLHDMATRLKREGVANCREFGQGPERLKADKQLLDLVLARRLAHDGNPLLRQHVDNADAKRSGEGIRVVKRSEGLKVDACVALSMAADRCLYYNL